MEHWVEPAIVVEHRCYDSVSAVVLRVGRATEVVDSTEGGMS